MKNEIIEVALSDLKPFLTDLRTMSIPNFEHLKKSICAFGYLSLIVISDSNEVISGGNILLALRELKVERANVIKITGLTDQDKIALKIAMNRVGGEWNFSTLSDILFKLEGNYDMSLTGFDEFKDVFSKDAEGELHDEYTDLFAMGCDQ